MSFASVGKKWFEMKFLFRVLFCLIFIFMLIIVTGCSPGSKSTDKSEEIGEMKTEDRFPENPNEGVDYSGRELKSIWLAGGCFWGVEAYMERVYGVADVTVGYANGNTENPSYEEVNHKNTGHAETVQVSYDPEKVKLETLLEYYFNTMDPTSLNRQGNDVGTQYRTGIYYKDEADLEIIKNVIAAQQKKYKEPIVTEVTPLAGYYLAEEYHQDYLDKNPGGYCHVDFSTLKGKG